MCRRARELAVDSVLEYGGTEQDLARWVEATKLVMKILERKRLHEESGAYWSRTGELASAERCLPTTRPSDL